MNSKHVRKVKIEPIILSSYKMMAQLMTSNANNVDNFRTRMNQGLNDLNAIGTLMKTTKMTSTRNPCGYHHATMLSNDTQRRGCLTYVWDRNEHREKGMHPEKHEFVTKKENLLLTLWRGCIQKDYEVFVT